MINIIAATQGEAEPVISALKVKRQSTTLNCYQTDDINLVVCGIGKCNTATACGWLAHYCQTTATDGSQSDAWLNLGIAGHQTAELGKCLVAHKITDLACEKVWFPHRVFTNTASADLVTVDQPLAGYIPDCLHDMEASAFVESARKFSDAELVQSLKIISDNTANPLSKVDKGMARKLIANNINSILECIDTLRTLSNTLTAVNGEIADTIRTRWHFSVSQSVKLERLLQRYNALLPTMQSIPDELLAQDTSKAVLSWLQQTVDHADITL